MRKMRYAVVGSGWRSLFYGRIAKALPERFELAALGCRTEEKAARMREEYGLPAVAGEAAVEAARPDFIVSAVNKQGMCQTVRHWLAKGYPVLSETPAALSMEELAALWQLRQAGAKVQVAEQYRWYPVYGAMLGMVRSGLLGQPVSAYLSAMHDYHAAGMLRGLLGLGREEMRLTGCTFAVPVTATRTRTEVLTAGEVVLKEQRHVLFEYENGCSAVYDFMSDQYHSLIRPRTLRLRGTRGELDDRTVCWLNDKNLPERAQLDVAGDPATGEVLCPKDRMLSGADAVRSALWPVRPARGRDGHCPNAAGHGPLHRDGGGALPAGRRARGRLYRPPDGLPGCDARRGPRRPGRGGAGPRLVPAPYRPAPLEVTPI